eukprot:228826_1
MAQYYNRWTRPGQKVIHKGSRMIDELQQFGYNHHDIRYALDNVIQKDNVESVKEFIDKKSIPTVNTIKRQYGGRVPFFYLQMYLQMYLQSSPIISKCISNYLQMYLQLSPTISKCISKRKSISNWKLLMAQTSKEAIDLMKKYKMQKRIVYMITNSDDNLQTFIATIRQRLNTEITIFGAATDHTKTLAIQYYAVHIIETEHL